MTRLAVRAQAHESKRVHIKLSMKQHQVRLDAAIAVANVTDGF
ncbi:MAG: hypothetical protein Q7K57_58820 [Burkholderiaceae bacterium]|nr:hypothetical protein [Burkholderiaceae bacterium]